MRIYVDDRAEIREGVEGGKFVAFEIVRDRLLRNAQPASKLGLRHPALFDRGSEIFLNLFKRYHNCSLHLLGVKSLDIRPLGVI